METVTLGPVSTAGSFNYFDFPNSQMAAHRIYTQDINGDGVDEIIFAGFETQPNRFVDYNNTFVHIFGWQNGKLQEVTAQWLPNGSNKVEGIGDVVYGDFNGDHKTDVLLATFADMSMNNTTHTYALMNTGNHFNKIDLGIAELQHGAAMHDINHDGYDDVITTGYGYSNGSTTVYMGSAAGLITYTVSFQGRYSTGGSGIALGDFLGNGTTTAILTDHQTSSTRTADDTVLMQINLNNQNHTFSFTPIAKLPIPFLENSDLNPGGQSHDVAAKSIDFNHDGLTDVMVISRSDWNGTGWPNISSIQFLKNLSGGKFEDVSPSMLSGYHNNAEPSYSPIFSDFTGDGLIDIFLGGSSSTPIQDSTTLLVQQSNGTFIDTGRSTLSAAVDPNAGMSTLAHGPDGKTYLVTESVRQDSLGGLTSTVSSQEMSIKLLGAVYTNPYLFDGLWTGAVPDAANWVTMGAADRNTIRPYLNPHNSLTLQLALTTEQRAHIGPENSAWAAQGHTLSLVGTYYDVTYFNNGTWNNNIPTANDWAHMGAADRDIIRALLTMPEALAIRDKITSEQWVTIVNENTLWAQQGHTLHTVGSAIPAPTQSPTSSHIDNMFVDYINLNTNTYQIDSGIRPTNCDWA